MIAFYANDKLLKQNSFMMKMMYFLCKEVEIKRRKKCFVLC